MRIGIIRQNLQMEVLNHYMIKSYLSDLLNTDKFLGAELFTMQSVGNGAGEFTDVQQPTMEGFEKMSQYGQSWSLVSEGPLRDVYEFRKEISHVTVVAAADFLQNHQTD